MDRRYNFCKRGSLIRPKLLVDHLQLFVELSDEAIQPELMADKSESGKDKLLEMTIDDLDLSVRSFNCLKRANINTVDDLINKSQGDMMKVRNLARSRLRKSEQSSSL